MSCFNGETRYFRLKYHSRGKALSDFPNTVNGRERCVTFQVTAEKETKFVMTTRTGKQAETRRFAVSI